MDDSVSVLKSKRVRKAKTDLESKTFRDGAIYLFRRADDKKPTWFCRVKVPNAKGYVSCSTKTTDEHAASRFADDLFLKTLVSVASGRDINSRKVVVAPRDYAALSRTEANDLLPTPHLSYVSPPGRRSRVHYGEEHGD